MGDDSDKPTPKRSCAARTTWRRVMSWTSRGSSICSLRTVCSTASAVCLARRATGVSNWAMWSSGWARCFPTFTGSCTGSTCSGDVVAIEVSIRGTFLGPFETPAGVIQPTWAKLDIPTADFWYVRDGSYDNDARRETRCDGSQILKTTGGHEHEGSSLEDDHRLGRGREPGSCYRRRAVAGCDYSRREHEGQRRLERERPVQAAAHRPPPDQA